MTVIDNRKNNLQFLSDIEVGATFLLEEKLYLKLCELTALDFEEGEIISVNDELLVEPVKTEINIVE